MLINARKWRERGDRYQGPELPAGPRQSTPLADQEGLNAVLHDDWGELDFRWNWQIVPDLKKAQKAGCWGLDLTEKSIIHYVTPCKPWVPGSRYRTRLYFRYVDETSWAGWRAFTSRASHQPEAPFPQRAGLEKRSRRYCRQCLLLHRRRRQRSPLTCQHRSECDSANHLCVLLVVRSALVVSTATETLGASAESFVAAGCESFAVGIRLIGAVCPRYPVVIADAAPRRIDGARPFMNTSDFLLSRVDASVRGHRGW